jgi:uncharacterized protein YcbX
MARPVTLDRAALLLEQIGEEQRSSDSDLIADQMRINQWQDALSDEETFELLADWITLFLATEKGIRLYIAHQQIPW